MRTVTKEDLEIVVSPDGTDTMTYRDLFKNLLTGLIEDGDLFSGKRACWNSDWYDRICHPLVDHGLIRGSTFYEDDEVEYEYESAEAAEALASMINLM